MKEALELGRKHHIHEDRCEQECEDQIGGGFVEHLHRAKELVRVAGGQPDLGNLIGAGASGGVERKVRRVVGVHRNLKLSVEPFYAGRPEAALNCGQVVESNLSDFCRRDHQPCKHSLVALLFGQQLNRNRVLFVAFLVGRDLILTGYHQSNGGRHVSGAHSQIGSSLTVDLYLELGVVQVEAGLNVEQSGYTPHSVGDFLGQLGRGLKIRA